MNQHVIKQYQLTVALKDKLQPMMSDLEKKYGPNDFRTTLISHPIGTLVIQILAFNANQVTFYSHDWYDKVNIPEVGRSVFTERYDMFVKYMGFVQFFSSVESELRKLVKVFKPGSCNDGKATYESIYKKILTDLDLTKELELFEFTSCFRNALHNSGIFLPSNSTDNKVITYRGNQYTFEYGKEIDFLFPELVAEIQDDIFDCLLKILNKKQIAELKA